jgi:hypothetical protein
MAVRGMSLRAKSYIKPTRPELQLNQFLLPIPNVLLWAPSDHLSKLHDGKTR